MIMQYEFLGVQNENLFPSNIVQVVLTSHWLLEVFVVSISFINKFWIKIKFWIFEIASTEIMASSNMYNNTKKWATICKQQHQSSNMEKGSAICQ